MSILTDKIRTKYPGAYDDMNDQTLEQKILAKYPQYQDLATPQPKTVGGFINNIPKSAGNFVTGMADSVRNIFNTDPNKNTLLQTGKLVNDAILAGGNLITGKPIEQDNSAARLVQHYKDKYVNHLGDTLYTDPVGSAMDVATVLSGTGGVLKGAGSALESSRLASLGNTLVKASEFVDPIQATGKVTGLAGQGINSVLRKNVAPALETASEAYATSGLGNPMKMKEIQGVTGKSVGQLMKEYDLFDRSASSVNDAIRGIDNSINLAIHGAPNADVLTILKAFDEKIKSLSSDAILSETARSQMADLLKRKQEFVSYIQSPTTSSTPLNIQAKTVLNAKQAVGSDVAATKWANDAVQTAKSEAAKSTYGILKDTVNELAGTKQLGRDEAGLIKLKQIFENADARGQARNVISLQDLVAMGATGAKLGPMGAIGSFIGKRALESPFGRKLVAGSMDKLSNAIETTKGIKAPSRVFSLSYPFSRTLERLTSPVQLQKQSQTDPQLTHHQLNSAYSNSIPPQSNFSSLLPTPKTSINTNLPTQPTESPVKKKRIGSVNIGSNGKPIMPNSMKYFSSFVK